MIVLERQATTTAPVAAVFAYLADFTTTTEWDPGTVSTVRVDGDGGVGTRYRNTSKLAGRTTELVYVVTDLRAPRSITLRGRNGAVVATDTITVEPFDGQTRVTYRAVFDFRGVWRALAPLLRPALRRLGDDAEGGLRTALARL